MSRLRLPGILVFASLLSIGAPLLGQEADMVVSAEAPEDSPVPAATTVITKEDIEASGARNLEEVLSGAPGIRVEKTGGILSSGTLSIRGSTGHQVLVIVDGRVLNTSGGSAVDLNAIPVSDIESVEVIRGGGSARWGEGAIGGVVRITTKSGDQRGFAGTAAYGFGSYNTHRLNLDGAFPLGARRDATLRLAADGLVSQGDYVYQGSDGSETLTNAGGWNAGGSIRFDWRPERGSLETDLRFHAGDRGVPGLIEFLTPEATLETRDLALRISGALPLGNVGEVRISGDGAWKNQVYQNPEDFIDDGHEIRSLSGSAAWNRAFLIRRLRIDLEAGIDGGWALLDSTGLSDGSGQALDGRAREWDASAKASAETTWGPLTLTPSLRYSYFLQEYLGISRISTGQLNWSAEAQGRFGDTVTVHATGGDAFRNPRLEDLFWPSGAFAQGNPDLQPERSLFIEGGVAWEPIRKLRTEATYHYRDVRDLIQWLPGAGGIWRPQNIGRARIQGVETLARWSTPVFRQGSLLEITASYDWLLAVNAVEGSVVEGRRLPYRPEHNAALRLALSGSRITVSLEGLFTGRRFINAANTKSLDPVFLLNAAARWSSRMGVFIAVSGHNLTNRSYVDRLGYPIPGMEITFTGGYTYQ